MAQGKKTARGKSSSERESFMSKPPGKDEKPVQPDSNEQSGSTGRRTAKGDLEQGKDTGQDRYGQSGLGGKGRAAETNGQASYRQQPSGDHESNRGSGRVDHEAEEYRKKPGVDRKA
jgi:hypothetical protein